MKTLHAGRDTNLTKKHEKTTFGSRVGELDHGHVQMHFRKSVGEFVRIRQKIAGAERHHNELVSHLQGVEVWKNQL